MSEKSCLGIIDWGIGGIGVLKVINKKLGKIPILYFSDTGAIPYGKMSRKELAERLTSVIKFMQTKGATHILIGCNAASTVISHLTVSDIPIEGMIESAVELATDLKPAKLGLIGGKRTILSGSYRQKFAERGIKLHQRIAQPLSAMIESGDISSEKLREECRKILAPIKNSSHILLACTHYPAISEVVKNFVSEKTVLLDPAEKLVERVEKWNFKENGTQLFFTSGDADNMKISAQNAFDFTVKKIEKVSI